MEIVLLTELKEVGKQPQKRALPLFSDKDSPDSGEVGRAANRSQRRERKVQKQGGKEEA